MTTPSQHVIDSMNEIDDCQLVLIVYRHADGGIRFSTNTNSRYDAYALACITKAFTEADLVVKEITPS